MFHSSQRMMSKKNPFKWNLEYSFLRKIYSYFVSYIKDGSVLISSIYNGYFDKTSSIWSKRIVVAKILSNDIIRLWLNMFLLRNSTQKIIWLRTSIFFELYNWLVQFAFVFISWIFLDVLYTLFFFSTKINICFRIVSIIKHTSCSQVAIK